jgi:hypothetical protein
MDGAGGAFVASKDAKLPVMRQEVAVLRQQNPKPKLPPACGWRWRATRACALTRRAPRPGRLPGRG